MWRGGMDGWPAELEPVQAAHPVRRQPARTPPDRKRLHHVFTRDLVGHLLLCFGLAPGRFLSDASLPPDHMGREHASREKKLPIVNFLIFVQKKCI